MGNAVIAPDACIWVTGAGGFLGSHVVRGLQQAGYTNILTSARVGPKGCDLLNPDSVHAFVAQHQPQLIIHCAAGIPNNTLGRNGAMVNDENMRMVDNLLATSAPRIVFASSMTVYSTHTPLPAKESDADPQFPYAQGKYEAELRLLASTKTAVILRFPGLFGMPRTNGLVYNLLHAATTNSVPTLPDAPVLWAAMHVEDAAEMMVRAVQRFPSQSMRLNVGYAGLQSITRFAQWVAQRYQRTWPAPTTTQPDFAMDLQTQDAWLGQPSFTMEQRCDAFASALSRTAF